MKVRVFQHAPFEGLGSIAAWLEERGAGIGVTRFFDGDRVPSLDGVDLLIAMGGPMSVNDEAELPWLVQEKQAVREAIARGTPVLGVCLGAQLVASALGTRVFRNREKEIGWFPVQGVDAGAAFRFPPEPLVFHWHGETFDLPPGAVRIAESPACANQAFQIGRRVIGLQFHVEMTPAGARAIVAECAADLTPDRFVQTAADILAAPPERYEAANALMTSVLDYLTA
jgi:GMP synthase-like glutamine amidotransferase